MSAEGSYSHEPKKVIMTVVNRDQALKLRKFVRSVEPHAFMMITNSSEIIGKGFRNTMQENRGQSMKIKQVNEEDL